MDQPAKDTRGISAHLYLIRINKQFGAAKAGIFEPVDLSDVPTKEFIEGAVTKYGVGLIYYSYMISYNTNKWPAGRQGAGIHAKCLGCQEVSRPTLHETYRRFKS